ncbi:DMT family transporter [Candidatus Peregrinibacteria bacterium]|jgi:drug/metabolite transporter (DMT)-like permease|nr:DMT family transporter [Candidatus Peregrinibacteria bacterium]MBT5468841.1 DMT family transporter [Candidatus Peregrinibacteria bacterium]MBT7337332.1 DMT family transporter [Candidatus Peregrinibacteria bacterium]
MHSKSISLPFLGTNKKARSISIGWIALGCAVLAGSTSVTFAKELGAVFSPMSLLVLSESIVLLFTVLSFGFLTLIEEITSIKKKHIPSLLVVGITNSIIAPLLVFTGLHMSEAVNAELFLRSYSFFLFIYAAIILKEKITRTDIFALLCMFIGVSVVALRGFSGPIQIATGDLLILSGAVVYAIGGIVFKQKLDKVHPEVVLSIRGIIAITFFLLLAPITEINLINEIKSMPFALLGALLGYGFISRFLYLFGFYESMERLQVHTVSLVLPLITIGSLTFAHIRLGETIQWFHVAGALFLIAGSVVMQLSSKHLKGKHLERHMHIGHRHHL